MNKKTRLIIGIVLMIAITSVLIIQIKINNNSKGNYEEAKSSKNIIKSELKGEYKAEQNEKLNNYSNEDESISGLSSSLEINLHDIDGKETNYIFTYNKVQYKAIYTKDNWKIIDSYTIINRNDMAIICKALIDIHPIHGKDMKSYRKVEDLVYEWEQHNLAYILLPDDNEWKKNVKDVDFNPEDQGKTIKEMYEARTGKKFSIEKLKKGLKCFF